VRRIPEPELMVDPVQVRAYAEADFEVPHAHCAALLIDRLAPLRASGAALDLGCGAADITLRVARALPRWTLDGIDGSAPMIEFGRRSAAAAGLEGRVRLHEMRLPVGGFPEPAYDLLFSNSLLHHLPSPETLWSAVRAASAPGAQVFVMDLQRPESEEEVEALVRCYARDEPEILRHDFEASLFAAYRAGEVREQLAAAGLDRLCVEVVSDRHWIAWGQVAGEA